MKEYVTPAIEVISITVEDVITASFGGNGTETTPDEF